LRRGLTRDERFTMNIKFWPHERPDLPAYHVIGVCVEVIGVDGVLWQRYTYASSVSALVAAAHDMERHGNAIRWIPEIDGPN